MKKSAILWAPLLALLMAGCEAPDIEGLNKMPKTTDSMANKMDTTNKHIEDTNKNMLATNLQLEDTAGKLYKQTLLVAITEMSKPENQALIFPIPTGLLAPGKAFAETATDNDLIEFVYMSLRQIEEVDPVTGLDSDLAPAAYTDAEKAKVRLQKYAQLYALMVVAGFTPDREDQNECERNNKIARDEDRAEDVVKCVKDRITPLIQKNVGRGRFSQTVLNFLALRGFFLREILLKESLKVATDKAEVLENSGMMKEAVKYLSKLDFISKLPFASQVQISLQEKQYNLITFEEKQDLEGQKATAEMWKVALQKAQAGMNAYRMVPVTSDIQVNQARFETELQEQQACINTMQQHVESWKGLLQ